MGDILVRTDSDHVKRRTVRRGRFYLVDFIEDPKFTDMPHLFLEHGGRYRERLLPNGFRGETQPGSASAGTRLVKARPDSGA